VKVCPVLVTRVSRGGGVRGGGGGARSAPNQARAWSGFGSPRALLWLPLAFPGLSEAFPESVENLVAEKYRKSHPKPPKMEVKSSQKSMKFVIK